MAGKDSRWWEKAKMSGKNLDGLVGFILRARFYLPGGPMRKTSWPMASFCMSHLMWRRCDCGSRSHKAVKYPVGTSSAASGSFNGSVTSPNVTVPSDARPTPPPEEEEEE